MSLNNNNNNKNMSIIKTESVVISNEQNSNMNKSINNKKQSGKSTTVSAKVNDYRKVKLDNLK
jgi:hypothetical protein